MTFALSLSDKFLLSAHDDAPPGQYHSASYWPAIDTVAVRRTSIYDNFGGARAFTASVWNADSVVWMRDTSQAGARLETFTYRRVNDATYWYAWHVRPQPQGKLFLGDSATCRRM